MESPRPQGAHGSGPRSSVLTKRCLHSHDGLGSAAGAFARRALREPELLAAPKFELSAASGLGDPAAFRPQSWPMFIGPGASETLAQVAIGAVRGLRTWELGQRDAPSRGNASQQPRLPAAEAVHAWEVARCDLVLTDLGPKVIEINTHAALGGWHPYVFLRDYMQRHSITTFLRTEGVLPQPLDPLASLALHLAETAHAHAPSGATPCAAVLVPERFAAGVAGILHSQAARVSKALDRSIHFVTMTPHAAFSITRSQLYLEAVRVDALLAFSLDCAVPDRIELAAADHEFALINRPRFALLGNKANLHEIREQELSRANGDSELSRSIPVTALVESPAGMQLLDSKAPEELVLKPANGNSGEGVYIGARLSSAAWARALASARQQGDYIVQEHCRSRPYLGQAGKYGACAYDVVWGVFVFGEHLGGMSVRMLPREDRTGVVNVARGACESIVVCARLD